MKKPASLYFTLQEAKKAVRRLKIKSQLDFVRRCKKDRRLSTHPYRTYRKKGWIDWYNFLGKKRPNFYKSYKQAQQAVKRLKITSCAAYKKRHALDVRLPSHPDEFYRRKGWKNWYSFFGKKKR
ncbi:integrase repeat-containing protein [Candidatus Omnitrophota bacterium]